MGFTKLDSGIIHSSIWAQPEYVRVVWTTILAVKNKIGIVECAVSGLRRACNLTNDPNGEKFNEAIKILESPDPESRSSEYDGRRIKKIEGGWLVLNSKKYRDMEYQTTQDRYGENRTGQIYFAGHDDIIKIGFSGNPWARIKELKTANPHMVLYSSFKGKQEQERALHDEFKDSNIDREWFYVTDKLILRIRELTGVDINTVRGTIGHDNLAENTQKTTTMPTTTTTVATPYVSVYASDSSLSSERSAEERDCKLIGFKEVWSMFKRKEKKIEAENWWINNRPSSDIQAKMIMTLAWWCPLQEDIEYHRRTTCITWFERNGWLDEKSDDKNTNKKNTAPRYKLL